MAFDAFLKLDGIKGESADAKHRGEIDIESFSWGMSQTGVQATGGGGGAGRVRVHDISFVKKTDASSPLLFLYCASGKHIKDATIVCRKAGGEQLEYLKIKLTDVLISSYKPQACYPALAWAFQPGWGGGGGGDCGDGSGGGGSGVAGAGSTGASPPPSYSGIDDGTQGNSSGQTGSTTPSGGGGMDASGSSGADPYAVDSGVDAGGGVRHPPQSGWLDELGRLKGGRPWV